MKRNYLRPIVLKGSPVPEHLRKLVMREVDKICRKRLKALKP